MLFLGVDFGWSSHPSGVAAARWDGGRLRLEELDRIAEPQVLLEWIDDRAAVGPALVAVDAPLIIPNESGMREPDRLAHRMWGRYHAGAYPANQRMPFAARTTSLSRELARRGFRHAASIEPLRPGRYQIECFPHAAIVQLFRLNRILKYKKGLRAERGHQLARLAELIALLAAFDPPLDAACLPGIPPRGSLKPVEDQLDALVCAYAGAYWWYWGAVRNDVLGTEELGYVVAPKRRALGGESCPRT